MALWKLPTVGCGNWVRLNAFWNSTRTLSDTLSLNRKFRLKLKFSVGYRKPRKLRMELKSLAHWPSGTLVHAAGLNTWVLVGSKQWEVMSCGSVWWTAFES